MFPPWVISEAKRSGELSSRTSGVVALSMTSVAPAGTSIAARTSTALTIGSNASGTLRTSSASE
jgi:hypothetical protein